MDSSTGPLGFKNVVRQFSNHYSNRTFDNRESKIFRMQPEPNTQFIEHGLLRYGSYGYEAEVEDVATGDVNYTRSPTEAETIPIYYRIWVDAGLTYALLGIQSYGGRSCVDLFNNELRRFYNGLHADYHLTVKKLIPNDLRLYANKVVKKISLIKRNEPTASLRPNLRPDQCDEVDLELTINPKKQGRFGRLSDLEDRIGGNITIDEIDYEGAFATIQVGKRSKRVGILGLSSSAGVIDVSGEVSFNANRHPEINSISRVFEGHMADFAASVES